MNIFSLLLNPISLSVYLLLGLTACQTAPETVITTEYVYSTPPDLGTLPRYVPASVQFEYPRQGGALAQVVIRTSPECQMLPKEQWTPEFIDKCVRASIDLNSNLLVGLDEKNLVNLQYNLRQQQGIIKLAYSKEQAYKRYQQDVKERKHAQP